MTQDYNISAGTDLKIFPLKKTDRVLEKIVESTLEPFSCVQSYSVFRMKNGGFFSRKILTICVLHNDMGTYPETNQALLKEMNSYFVSNGSIGDCISLDTTDNGQKKFAEILSLRLKFKEIRRIQPDSAGNVG